MITRLGRATAVLSRSLYWISCVSIIAIVFVTCFDVIMRRLGVPIDYAFEVVCALAGVVIGFALPETTLTRTHVRVELLDTKLPESWLRVVNFFSRGVGIAIFLIIGWNAVRLGDRLLKSGQYSAILQIPDFPFAYALGMCCFVVCLVLFLRLFRVSEEKQT